MRNTSGRFFIWLIFIFFILTISSIYFTHIFDIEPEPVNEAQNRSSFIPHFAGLVLARGGSKGIPYKNIVKLKNLTLISRALQTMSDFGKFDSIWVSTDDKNIANEAKKNKVSIHWRAAYTATDTASSLIAVKEFLEKHEEVTQLGLIQCTSPFLKIEYLNDAFKLMTEKGYNSVFSITRRHNLRWGYNSSGYLQPENFDMYHRPRRQDWDGDLVENGMFYFTEANLVKEHLVLQGGRVGIVEIPANQSLEIDTFADLEIAELYMNHFDDL